MNEASSLDRVPTVMVVGRDEGEVCLLSSVLRLKGFDVLEAENGQVAIDLATRWRPELILIELELPTIRALRRLSKSVETPIISFSLPGLTKRDSLAISAGCIAHLAKPIDFELLDRLIDEYFPGYHLELVSALVH
jgi:CheY-like chemotaxis protein